MLTHSYIISNTHITIVFPDGFNVSIGNEEPRYRDVVEAVKTRDWERARELTDTAGMVKSFVEETGIPIRIENGTVLYEDEPIHNTLTNRMLEMIQEGFDITALIKFMGNLMDNPSKQSVDELYGFLEASNLPITEDGHFLAYKIVTSDYKDYRTKSHDNSIGKVLEMPRRNVDDNRNRTCSSGYHFCGREYLGCYGGADQRVMIAKINPADVVSIPVDYNNHKGRTCKYEIVGELEQDSSGNYISLEGAYRPSPKPTSGYYDKSVAQYSLVNGYCLDVFNSIREASKDTGVSASNIKRVCIGERKSAGGYYWKFADEDSE